MPKKQKANNPVIFKVDPKYTRYNKLIDILDSITGVKWGYMKQKSIIAGISSDQIPLIIDFDRETKSKVPVDFILADFSDAAIYDMIQHISQFVPVTSHYAYSVEFTQYIAESNRCCKKYGVEHAEPMVDRWIAECSNRQFKAEKHTYTAFSVET